jgi:hypothetical protein
MEIILVYNYAIWVEECTNNFFKGLVVVSCKEFIYKFLEVYLDDWTMFSLLKDHFEVLILMLDRCKQCHIPLNIKKCIFSAPFGILLGNVVCK